MLIDLNKEPSKISTTFCNLLRTISSSPSRGILFFLVFCESTYGYSIKLQHRQCESIQEWVINSCLIPGTFTRFSIEFLVARAMASSSFSTCNFLHHEFVNGADESSPRTTLAYVRVACTRPFFFVNTELNVGIP